MEDKIVLFLCFFSFFLNSFFCVKGDKGGGRESNQMLPSTFVKKGGGTLSVMQHSLVKHFVFKYSGVRYVYGKGSYKKENPKKKNNLLPF